MELTLNDVAKMLNVSTKTIYRWVDDEKIPYYRVNKQYRFDQRQLEDWAAAQGRVPKGMRAQSTRPRSLLELIERGGIHYRLEGETIINAILHAMPLFPDLGGVDPNSLLEALVLREEMQCTGVGQGLALPHPRRPAIPDPRFEFISICMLDTPIAADTVDGEPVHSLIFIVCSEEIRHVRIMAQTSHLCRQPDFVDALRVQASRTHLNSIIHQHLS